MNHTLIWDRLLWKSFKEGWLVVLLVFAAPPILFSLANQMWDWQRGLFAFPAAAGAHLAIALWAAGRGGGKRQSSEHVWTHLPLTPTADWLSSLVVPTIITAGLGLWYGAWVAGMHRPDVFVLALSGALDLATTYLVCYFISAVISNWAAVIFGALRMVGGTLISVWDLSSILLPDAIGFVARTAVGSLLASLLFVVIFQKKSLGFRQITSLCLLVVVIFAPGLKDLDISWLRSPENLPQLSGGQGYSLTYEVRSVVEDSFIRFRIENLEENTITFTDFKLDTQMLDMLDDKYVYLAQQLSLNDEPSILKWNVESNRVEHIAKLPAPGCLLNYGDVRSYVSPNGHYLILTLKSLIGNGVDVWEVNLRTGKSAVILPHLRLDEIYGHSQYSSFRVSWEGNHAFIWGFDRIYRVDLIRMQADRQKVDFGGRY